MSFIALLVRREGEVGGEREGVMIHLLCETTTVSLLSSAVYPPWNVKDQVARQAAQGLSSLVYRSSRAHEQ